MLKSRFHKLVAAFAVFAVLGSLFAPAATAVTYSKTVTVHYHRFKGDYDGWNLWLWPAKGNQSTVAGVQSNFTGTDAFGKFGTWTITGKDANNRQTIFDQVGIIARKGNWEAKDAYSKDRFIESFVGNAAEIWIVEGDETLYESEPNVVPEILSAQIDSLRLVTLQLNMPFIDLIENSANGFTITGPSSLNVTNVTADASQTELTLQTDADIPLDGTFTLHHADYEDVVISVGDVLNSAAFNELFNYTGDDLGATYSADHTDFRVWAPTATEVELWTYTNATGDSTGTYDMVKSDKGTWTYTLNGDQNGTVYLYRAHVGSVWNYAVDPYAIAATIQGDRGVVVDLDSTDPAGFAESSRPAFSGKPTDAVFYELHVRDLSKNSASGIPSTHKGKFLALTDAGTTTPDKKSKTGIDAITELGVTHVQLLPIYDYNSVDESRNDQFNWGYDPKNYNVVEGSYSTNPANPTNRINELKQAVQYMHTRKLRVIMDVVYNHVADAGSFSFEQLVPGYFFRKDSSGQLANGTGCGNEVASERPMVRKFIVDSVKYWASEYKLDGFRFDLMGILDVTTMNQVRAALTEIDPTILVIGEGWNMGELDSSVKAFQGNVSLMPGIGMFNDGIRDGIKGSVFNASETGWATGDTSRKNSVMGGIVGNVQYNLLIGGSWGPMQPGQSVNYVEAHDNLTLYDKLMSSADGNAAAITRQFKLSSSIVLLSQGMPFMQAGQEWMRSKDGNDNSYNASDAINSLRWNKRTTNMAVVRYFKGLIAIRKAHPAFRMSSASDIKRNLKFIKGTSSSVIAYSIDGSKVGDTWKTVVVIHNSSTKSQVVTLPAKGNWSIASNGNVASTKAVSVLKGATKVTVPAQSTYVMFK